MILHSASFFLPDDFTQTQRIVAAVSGGGDSLALLFLLHDYLEQRGERQRLVAVTVDHGLRAESAQEAERVAQLCAQRKIPHRVMCWQGKKPQTALSHQARVARYDLLCQAAREENAQVIVTGHTLDDQAETYTMRVQRGRGRGLAAMPRHALLQQEFCLLRPLLGVRRQVLREYLQGQGLVWIDDPSNDNPDYERVRVRNTLDGRAIAQAQCAVAQAAVLRRQEAQAMALLARKLHMHLREERLWFNLRLLSSHEEADLASLLAVSAAIMGGREHPSPERQKLLPLIRSRRPQPQRVTRSGSVIEVTEKFVRIWRERRNLERATVSPGQTVVWDGRYRICNRGGEVLTLRPPSQGELRQLLAAMPDSAGNRIDLHWPSLETTCMICSRGAFALPVLNSAAEFAGVTVQRIMRPFNWLVSGDDRALYDVFYPVFAAGGGENDKNRPE